MRDCQVSSDSCYDGRWRGAGSHERRVSSHLAWLSASRAQRKFRLAWAQGNGTIRHIRAALDPAAMGCSLEAQIEVKLKSDTSAFDFEAALPQVPQVVAATLMTRSFDYALRAACEDRQELMLLSETLRRHAGVLDTYTRLILRDIQLSGLV